MPVYKNNNSNTRISFGNRDILPGESWTMIQTIPLTADQYQGVIKISDEPFWNPIFKSETVSGHLNDTATVELKNKVALLDVENASSVDIEIYFESVLNTPPIPLSANTTLRIRKLHYGVSNLIIKFLGTATKVVVVGWKYEMQHERS